MIERLATLPQVADEYRPYAVSPDGRLLAFEWYRDGDWQVFLLDLEHGGEPRRVADLPDSCGCPLFSPDGYSLFFSRDDGGSERFDVYRLELATGTLVNLTPDTPRLSPLPDFDLSPDGRLLACAVDHGESYAAATLPAAVSPGAAGLRILVDHYYNDWSPRFSPDGRRVAFHADTHGQDAAVFIVELDSGEQTVIGGEPPLLAFLSACSSPWSPDGRSLVFHGGPFEHPGIGVYDVERGTVGWVWVGDQDAHHAAWSPDGRALAFLVDEGVETSLWHLDLATQKPRCLSVGPGNHYAPSFTPDGRAVLCCFSAADHPTELFRIDLGTDEVVQLTDGMPADLKDHPFVSGELVWFASGDHLAQVPGLLCVPDEPNGAAVVMIHGGPTWHHANEWDALRQAFLHEGCTVLSPNYRGSDGYGRPWQLANRWLIGQGEVQDCAAACDILAALGCDPARIAVTGRSHGGYLTMACLWQFPALWACGVAGVPFFDHIDAQLDPAIREDLRWWDRENVGDIESDRDRLVYFSPINHLHRIRAPLLILGAENDPRCPPTQISQVVERLQAQGNEVEAHVYAGEGHGITAFADRRDYDRRTVEFILRHIAG
jgi:dipeptidyl aminopeptidase/acylaminoacyl peptidase